MPRDFAKDIGRRIRVARLAARLTPRQLEDAVPKDELAAVERGDQLPTLDVLSHLAAMCDVPLTDLLPEDGLARWLRPPAEPARLDRAPDLETDVRVFATGADTIDGEYKPEDEQIEVDERIAPIAARIDASAGVDVITTTAEVGRSIGVLTGNIRELRAALVALADPRSLWLWDGRRQREMAEALGEVTRKLHNYVAAAATLRDHAARFVERHYPEGSAERQRWNEQTDAHFGAPERVLVNQLRNYSVHRALPILRAVHGDQGTGGGATFIVLDTAELLQSDKWSPPVREWLRARELIDLAEVVSAHWDAIERFYRLFDQWIRETQAATLEELKELERERDALLEEISPGLREAFDYLEARRRGEFVPVPPRLAAELNGRSDDTKRQSEVSGPRRGRARRGRRGGRGRRRLLRDR